MQASWKRRSQLQLQYRGVFSLWQARKLHGGVAGGSFGRFRARQAILALPGGFLAAPRHLFFEAAGKRMIATEREASASEKVAARRASVKRLQTSWREALLREHLSYVVPATHVPPPAPTQTSTVRVRECLDNRHRCLALWTRSLASLSEQPPKWHRRRAVIARRLAQAVCAAKRTAVKQELFLGTRSSLRRELRGGPSALTYAAICCLLVSSSAQEVAFTKFGPYPYNVSAYSWSGLYPL